MEVGRVNQHIHRQHKLRPNDTNRRSINLEDVADSDKSLFARSWNGFLSMLRFQCFHMMTCFPQQIIIFHGADLNSVFFLLIFPAKELTSDLGFSVKMTSDAFQSCRARALPSWIYFLLSVSLLKQEHFLSGWRHPANIGVMSWNKLLLGSE